jgi:hypothetical protein
MSARTNEQWLSDLQQDGPKCEAASVAGRMDELPEWLKGDEPVELWFKKEELVDWKREVDRWVFEK